MEVVETVVGKRLEGAGDVEGAELRPLVADDGVDFQLGEASPVTLGRELVVRKTELELVLGVLLAERRGRIERDADCEIAVDVQLRIDAGEEQELQRLGQDRGLPVRVVQGVGIGRPEAVGVRGVDGLPVRVDEGRRVGGIRDDAVDEGLDGLPLQRWLGRGLLRVMHRGEQGDDFGDEGLDASNGAGSLNAVIEVGARAQSVLLLDGAEDGVVDIPCSSLLERGDASFAQELERSAAGLQVLLVRGTGRTGKQVEAAVLQNARGLLAAGQAHDLAVGRVGGRGGDVGQLQGARVGDDGMVVAGADDDGALGVERVELQLADGTAALDEAGIVHVDYLDPVGVGLASLALDAAGDVRQDVGDGQRLVVEIALEEEQAARHDVHVRIHQPRHHHAAVEVDDLGLLANVRLGALRRSGIGNDAVLDRHASDLGVVAVHGVDAAIVEHHVGGLDGGDDGEQGGREGADAEEERCVDHGERAYRVHEM